MARQSEQHTVDEDVLAPGELRMKPRAQLDEGRHAPVDAHHTTVGPVDTRDELEQCALARAVPADYAEHPACLDGQVHIAQRGEPIGARPAAAADEIDHDGLERGRLRSATQPEAL